MRNSDQPKLPHMPLYVDDYEAHTAHLTVEEDGIYSRMLRLCWRTAGCSVPNDPIWVARKMRMVGQFEDKIEPILKEYFRVINGRWRQKRQTIIFHKVSTTVSERKIAGQKGGDAKARKQKEKVSGKGTDLPEQKASKALASKTKGKGKEKTIKRKTELPKDSPTAEDREKAEAYWLKKGVGLDTEQKVVLFRAHHKTKANLYADWSAAWRTWYVNAAEYAKRDGKGQQQPVYSGNGLSHLAAVNRWDTWQVGHWKPEWGDTPEEMGCKTLEEYLAKVTAAKGEAA